MPQRQIFCAAYRCGKTQRLVQVAREALAGGMPASRIVALTVHRPAANVLSDMLRDVTGQSVPTTTLRRRALTILQTFPAAACLPAGWSETEQLSGIDRRRLARQAWTSAGAQPDSLFARRGHQPGAIDWVALLFDRFSEWCGSADPARLPDLQPDDAALAELWQAYRIYLQLCRRHRVVAFNEVFNRAIDVLRDSDQAAPRLLLLDDLDLFQPAELLFATALIAPTTAVYAAATSAPRADSALALERLLHRWTATHRLQLVNDATAQPAPALTVGEYTTPDAEAHAIARRILAQTHTARYDDIALVAFDAELVPLLQRVLPQYGLPVQGQHARDGYTLALAPLALAGLKLLAGQALSRPETTALLRHAALGLSSADARAAVEAVEQQRFQPFDAADQRWPSALSTAGRARLAAVRVTTATIRATGHASSAQLQSWLKQLEFEQRAWAQTTAALEPWAVAIDRRHWARLLDFLRQAERLSAALHTPLTPDEAIEVFSSAQALITPEGQPHTGAIQIWQPSALGGCTARLVFAAGLHEGALPQPLPPLPFADDDVLAATFSTLPGFVAPQLHDRAAAWERAQHDLQLAIGLTLDAIHISYSRTDRQGRARLVSPVVAAQIDAQIDRHGALQSPNLSIETTLPTTAEHVGELATWPQRFAETTLIALPPPLPVSAPVAESPFVISPSAIEDYFTCTRRCFYSRMLGLYDIVSSPRQALGQVVHDALNDLLHDARDGTIEAAHARGLVARHWPADDHRWGSRLKQTVFRRLVEKAVMQLARYEVDHGAGTTFLGGELRFRWQMPNTDVVVSGRIDRIDRSAAGLHVIDYKLGQQSPSINELLREFVPPRDEAGAADWRPGDIQLPVYALALEQGEVEGLARPPHERVASVALIYPLELYGDNGKLSAKGRREIALVDHSAGCAACDTPPERSPKTGTLCRAQLAAVATRVHGAVARMRAAEWQPDPREGSQTCAGCAFRPICSDPQ